MRILRRLFLSPLVLLPVFFILSFLGRPDPARGECASLLVDRCTACHYLTRVCDKVAENKGKWSWKRTVRNMVRQGAKLNAAEEEALVDCLGNSSPGVQETCGAKK